MNSPNTNLTNDLPRQLTHLGLHATADNLEDLLARATKGRWAPRVLLEEIARAELAERGRRGLQRRLARSRLGRFKMMADFDWHWPKKIDREAIERAFTLEFLKEGRNFILVGTNGLGKTMISKNIAHAAVMAGYSVVFRTAAELIEDLQVDSPQLRRKKLAHYGQPHLVCIDEVGYLSYDNHAADLLYEVVNRRYEQKSLIVTTNLLCGAPHKRFNAESTVMQTDAEGRGSVPWVCHRGWPIPEMSGRLTTPHYPDVFLQGGRHALSVVRLSRAGARAASGFCGRVVGGLRSRALGDRLRPDYSSPPS
jgi:DNA replication protein DnaC